MWQQQSNFVTKSVGLDVKVFLFREKSMRVLSSHSVVVAERPELVVIEIEDLHGRNIGAHAEKHVVRELSREVDLGVFAFVAWER